MKALYGSLIIKLLIFLLFLFFLIFGFKPFKDSVDAEITLIDEKLLFYFLSAPMIIEAVDQYHPED